MSDRIERLGELYDKAVERIDARCSEQEMKGKEKDLSLSLQWRDLSHSWDIAVIRTYLEHMGKRPVRVSDPQEVPLEDNGDGTSTARFTRP